MMKSPAPASSGAGQVAHELGRKMKSLRIFAAIGVAVAACVIGAGCSHEDDILKQQADAKKLPPPTAAQMKQGWAQIQQNHDKSKQDEIAWAAAHPDKVAAVNAARAQSGKPPLGQ
jgi:hypothetical protein